MMSNLSQPNGYNIFLAIALLYNSALSLSIGVFFLYPCNASAVEEGSNENVVITFNISAYTRDKVYESVILYFSKLCDSRAPKGEDLYCIYVCDWICKTILICTFCILRNTTLKC